MIEKATVPDFSLKDDGPFIPLLADVYTRSLFSCASQKNTRQWHKVSSCKAFCAICLNMNFL